MSQILSSWSTHVASWADMNGPEILVLRYEELLEKPVKAIGKIARLVGLGDNRKRIARAIDHSSFPSLAKRKKRDGFREVSDKTERFFRKGKANQWRKVLSRDQVSRIVADHRE